MFNTLYELHKLEFGYGFGNQQQDDLPPIRLEAEYEAQAGDFPVRVRFTLSANDTVTDEVIERYANELRFFGGIFEPRHEETANERKQLVSLLEQAAELLESTWRPEEFPAGLLMDQVNRALDLARHWTGEQGTQNEPDESEIPGQDNVLFIAFDVHPDDQKSIPSPAYLVFEIDPTISPGDPDHSYPVSSPEAVYTVNTSGGIVRAGFTLPSRDVGVTLQSLPARFDSSCFRVRGVSANSQYRITGGMMVDYSSPFRRSC